MSWERTCSKKRRANSVFARASEKVYLIASANAKAVAKAIASVNIISFANITTSNITSSLLKTL